MLPNYNTLPMSDSNSNRSGGSIQSFLIGAGFGAAVGAVFALLYAPKKGKELREDISTKVGDLSSKFTSLLSKAKEAGEDLLHHQEEVVDETLHAAYERAEQLIEEADRIINDAKSRINPQ